MSLKWNVVCNLLGQFYVALIGIVTLPLFLRLLGAEAYGLIGFYATLQAWLQLLDLGLSPMMSREVARFRGGQTSPEDLIAVYSVLKRVFLVISLCIVTVFLSGWNYLATEWLQYKTLDRSAVEFSLGCIMFILALRWISGLYRLPISGYEDFRWLSIFSVISATAKFILVIPILVHYSSTITVYFVWQLVVVVLELLILTNKAKKLMPSVSNPIKVNFGQLKSRLKFSLSIAFTGGVWIFITQLDRLLLSKILTLSDFGYFTTAVMLAMGVSFFGNPIGSVLLPRFAKLEAEGRQEELLKIYRKATRIVVILTGGAALLLAFNAYDILLFWTGNAELSSKGEMPLILYSLGYGVLGPAAFPYYLQYAKGDLRYHLLGNLGFVVVLVPAFIFAAANYGAVGTGSVWLGLNLISLFVWLPLVHRKFAPGINFYWYCYDVLGVWVFMGAFCWLAQHFISASSPWSMVLSCLVLASAGIMVVLFDFIYAPYGERKLG